MPIRLTKTDAYSDLGDVWLRNQLARLAQLHLQFGGHYRIDADSLLAGWARTARAAKAAAESAATKVSTEDRIWQATIEAIELSHERQAERLVGRSSRLSKNASSRSKLLQMGAAIASPAR